jgi:hypothetical protein
MLANYAVTNDVHVAIVSADHDFRNACSGQSRLLYFKNLEEVTASLLKNNDTERVLRYTFAIEQEFDAFKSSFFDALNWLPVFLHLHHGITVETSRTEEAEMQGFTVMAIGKEECTIAFDAKIDAEHKVSWVDPNNPDQRMIGYVREVCPISGTAKVAFTSTKKKKGKREVWELEYKSVSAIEFDNYGAVTLRTLPSNYEPPVLPQMTGGLLGSLSTSQVFPTGMIKNPYITMLEGDETRASSSGAQPDA